MTSCSTVWSRGCPRLVGAEIVDRAEGIPLYAVETVRMLLDRGLLSQEGARYVLTGDVADLEVPETLHALVASRLDGLDAAERALLQDASVLGQSFTPAALIAVSGRAEPEVTADPRRPGRQAATRLTDDLRSAERGQYSFLQALLRTVAYGTLSRRDRKAKHLAVAEHLQQAWGEEAGDIAEVLAIALPRRGRSRPGSRGRRGDPCTRVRDARGGRQARDLAGARARGTQRTSSRPPSWLANPEVQGRLLREAGNAAMAAGELPDSVRLLEAAAEVLQRAGLGREAARVEGLVGNALLQTGHREDAEARLARAYAALDDGSDDEAFAEVAVYWARMAFMGGEQRNAMRLADAALPIAEGKRLGRVLVNALNTKANLLASRGRPAESNALLSYAVELAVDQDLGSEAIRGFFNLADADDGRGAVRRGRAGARPWTGARAPPRRPAGRASADRTGDIPPDRARALGRGARPRHRAESENRRSVGVAGRGSPAVRARPEG